MRPSLPRNVIASVLNAVAVLATALVSVPLILDAVGTAGYGAWTLGLTVILYISILETGLGPAIQRFVAAAGGANDTAAVQRLLATTLVAYVVLGLAVLGLLQPLAGPIADLVDLPADLREQGEDFFRVLGVPLLLALLSAGLSNVLGGLQRFAAVAVTGVIGAVAFLVAIVLLVEENDLVALAQALAIQQLVLVICRLAALRDVASPRGLADRATLRQLVGFSARLQATVFAELINWQSDKLVVAAVSNATTLGQLGIGAQLADGGRLLSGAALSPITASLAHTAGTGDDAALRRDYLRLHRIWTLGVGGTAVLLAANAHPLIEAWLGDGYQDAGTFGTLLIAGSAFGLLTGTGIAYMRAVGRPSLEARFGVAVVGLNLLFTIPLALALGPFGVVSGTIAAYALGAAYFFSRLRHEVPVWPFPDRTAALRTGASLAVVSVASVLLDIVWAGALPAGFALLPVGITMAAALAIYLRVALGRPQLSRRD